MRARRRGFASMMAADDAQEMEVEGKRSGGKGKGRDQLKRNIKKKKTPVRKRAVFFFFYLKEVSLVLLFFLFLSNDYFPVAATDVKNSGQIGGAVR